MVELKLKEGLARAHDLFTAAANEGLHKNLCVAVVAEALAPTAPSVDFLELLRDIDQNGRKPFADIFGLAGLEIINPVNVFSLPLPAATQVVEGQLAQVNPEQGIVGLVVTTTVELGPNGTKSGHLFVVIPSNVAPPGFRFVPECSLLLSADKVTEPILKPTTPDLVIKRTLIKGRRPLEVALIKVK